MTACWLLFRPLRSAAGLAIEDMDQPSRVLVRDAGDHPKSLFLNCSSQLSHAEPGGMFAFKIFVDNGNGKGLKKLHGLFTPNIIFISTMDEVALLST